MGDVKVNPGDAKNRKLKFHRKWFMNNVHDCTIIVGDKKKFPACKGVLGLRSQGLYSILFAPSTDQKFEIPDIQPKAFETLLRFFYDLGDDIIAQLASVEEALDLFYAVRKFEVFELEDSLVDYLAVNVDADSMFSLLKLLKKLGLPRLEKVCLDVFSTETLACLKSEKFLRLPIPLVLLLFKQERYCREIEMLYALERYVQHNNLKLCLKGSKSKEEEEEETLLEDIMREVHFLMISPEEYAMSELSLLSKQDLALIVAHVTTPDTTQPLPSFITTEEKRFSLFVEQQFRNMRDLFPKIGGKVFQCSCGKDHDLRKDFWQHKYKDKDKLKRLEAVLNTAGLPYDLEVISKTQISAVKREMGRLMKGTVKKSAFEFAWCVDCLVEK